MFCYTEMKGKGLEQMVWTVAYMVLDFCPLHLPRLKAACSLNLQNTCLHTSLGYHTAIPYDII